MNTLLAAIKDKEPILFIGAGFSKCLGIPDWQELTFKILDLLEEDEEVRALYKTLIQKNRKTLLNTIDEYENKKAKIYSDVIKKDLRFSDSNPGLAKYKKLWDVSDKIITTNYDKALDITGKESKEIITNKNDFELARLQSTPNYLLKLHGTIDNAESCTLFSSDYKTIYDGDTLVKDVFESIVKNNVIIFIGFSMEDPYVKEIFERINILYKNYLDNHFIITVGNKNDFSNLNINAIDIPDWHSGLDKLLDDLILNRAAIQPVVAKPASSLQITTPINILNTYPNPDILFTGREVEKLEFKNSLTNYRLFAIEGLGGYGKTDFAAKCIEEFIEQKGNIVWLDGNSESKFEVFVQSMGYGEMMKGENKTKQAIFSSLKDLIERDEKIIFIDNFQSLTDELFKKFIEYAKKYLAKSSIILITKKEIYFDGAPPHTISIKGLDKNSIEFAKKIKNSEPRFLQISDDDLEILSKNTLGHPLAIKLSMTLLEKGINVNSLISKIVEYKGQGLSEVEELTKRIFDEVYEHPSTTEIEKGLLQLISVFNGRVPLEAINFLFEGDSFIPLSNLGDNFLVNKDEGQFELHPLIKELAYKLLEYKTAAHAKAAEYFINKRTEKLEPILEEQVFYHLSESKQWEKINREINEKGRQFILLGQLSLIKEFIDKLIKAGINNPLFYIFYGDIEQINATWEKAKQFYEQATLQNINMQVKAEGIIKTGEILFRRGDIKESKKYFNEALTFCQENKLHKEESRAINDLGLVDEFEGNLDDAFIKFEKALLIRKEIRDEEGIAITLDNLGSIYSTKNNFLEALKKHEESLNIKIKMGDRRGIAIALHFTGDVYHLQNRLIEALKKYQEGLKIYEDIGDLEGIANVLGSIGIIYYSQDKLDESLEIQNEALKKCQDIGDKVGISAILCNIGLVYKAQNKLNESLDIQLESLKISQDIGDKNSISISNHNIACIYADDGRKEYDKAILLFFKTLILNTQMGIKSLKTTQWLNTLREDKLGRIKFKALAYSIFDKLDEAEKKYINIRGICKESIRSTKPSKNEPCPCGSGKLYKRCHGKE